MEIITITFNTGEAIPQPGSVFNTRKPDAPQGVARVHVVSILGIQWVGKKHKATGVAVTMAAVVEIPEGGAGQ